MKKALVFGGNGFLGAFLVKELCEKNFQIVIAARSNSCIDNLKTLGFPGQITLRRFNVASSNLDEFDFTKFDLVVNLVGIGAEKGKNTYQNIHVLFPSSLAEKTSKYNTKLVHISAFTGEGVTKSKYVNSKREGEIAVLKNNPKAIIIRPSVMIGEGGSLVQTFEAIINNSPIVPFPLNGKTKIQPVFAGDVAKSIVLAAENPEFQGKAFNLAGTEIILFKDFLERICGFMDKKRLILRVPFFFISFALTLKEFLPSFIFRTTLTKDIFALSKENLIIEKTDLTKFVEKPHKIDDVLDEILAKYKLYE